jgi:Uma2 family endonuclease
MAQPAPKALLSEQDYLEGERTSHVRHEHVGGETYAMVGARDCHGLIAGNLFAALRPNVRGSSCQLFNADMKLRVQVAGEVVFYYSDLLLSCDPEDRGAYFRSGPCLIVEILSEATERIDRREKLYAYTQIPSLREYLLLAQDPVEAELHRREVDTWKTLRFTEGTVPLACLNLEIPLATMCEDVSLPDASPSTCEDRGKLGVDPVYFPLQRPLRSLLCDGSTDLTAPVIVIRGANLYICGRRWLKRENESGATAKPVVNKATLQRSVASVMGARTWQRQCLHQ